MRSARLTLRPWTLDDVPAAFRVYGDPRVTRYIGGITALDLDHCVTEPENTASQRVALRIGFRHLGRTRAYYEGLELDHFTLENP